jgi:hypothetical protein
LCSGGSVFYPGAKFFGEEPSSLSSYALKDVCMYLWIVGACTFCVNRKKWNATPQRKKYDAGITDKMWYRTGLPDGLFSNQKSQFGYILEGLAMVDVGNFFAIWIIFRPFGIFLAIWYFSTRFGTFYPFWYVVPRKIWQPWYRISKTSSPSQSEKEESSVMS